MRVHVHALASVLCLVGLVACDGDTKSAAPAPDQATVRLPEGDAARGREAFDKLRCWTCHGVVGEEFHDPVTDTPTGVTLGEKWERRLTADEIADSILNPSHEISDAYTEGVVTSGTLSRMGMYSHMEVQQLTDLVAFLRDVNERNLPDGK